MTLERFRSARLVALNPGCTAFEAARAMLDNHIGTVLAVDRSGLVGIVTDRDLAIEIGGTGSDARLVSLADVMTEDVKSVEIDAGVEDVLCIMRDSRCRRVPITEDGRPVGLVTLDDLLLEGSIEAEQAAAVVRAQLETEARYKRGGETRPGASARPPLSPPRDARAFTRHAARAETAYVRLLQDVQRFTDLEDRHRAELALKVVVGLLCRRIPPTEAAHFIAQLPSILREELILHLDGPNRRITKAGIVAELSEILSVDEAQAVDVLEGVAGALTDCISAGQIVKLRDQLPDEMKSIFPMWAPRELMA